MQQQQQQQMSMNQQQAMMHQPPNPHPDLSSLPPQIESILSGNSLPGFDPTCRSVYVGNIHLQVTERLLQDMFSSTGPVEGCKLIRKEKSSDGFVDYFDPRSAGLAIVTLHGRQLFGMPIEVNWAYTSNQREDTSEAGQEKPPTEDAPENNPQSTTVYVGNLSPEIFGEEEDRNAAKAPYELNKSKNEKKSSWLGLSAAQSSL